MNKCILNRVNRWPDACVVRADGERVTANTTSIFIFFMGIVPNMLQRFRRLARFRSFSNVPWKNH